jgi:hypothetical protein
VDPESGSRREKMTHKNRKKSRNFMFEVLDSLFRAESFSKLFLIKIKSTFF